MDRINKEPRETGVVVSMVSDQGKPFWMDRVEGRGTWKRIDRLLFFSFSSLALSRFSFFFLLSARSSFSFLLYGRYCILTRRLFYKG